MRINVTRWERDITLGRHTYSCMSAEYHDIAREIGSLTTCECEKEYFTIPIKTKKSVQGKYIDIGFNRLNGEIFVKVSPCSRAKEPKLDMREIEQCLDAIKKFYEVMGRHNLLEAGGNQYGK